jgi:hypothetical protein
VLSSNHEGHTLENNVAKGLQADVKKLGEELEESKLECIE